MARLFYTLAQALGSLKTQIEYLEAKHKAASSAWERRSLEEQMEWMFERGLNMIQYSKPGETEPALLDWFLGRIKGDRPDINRLKSKLKKNDHEKNK